LSKAKVEQAVLIVERWLIGRLRRRTFYSLADVDAALGELMTQLNEKQPLRRLGVTRRQLLEEVDRPALKALPDEPYEYSEWRVRRVGVDYHVDIDAHYGPCALFGHRFTVRPPRTITESRSEGVRRRDSGRQDSGSSRTLVSRMG
jgi:hypothetical protein